MKNIAIIEDSLPEVDRLRTFFARFSEEHDIRFNLTHFENAESFLNRYRPIYDIVLMDIMLPGMNGMDAAIRLRKLDNTVTLIFITNMAQFAVKGYEVFAFDFVVKPMTYPNFTMKMQRVLNKLNNQRDTQVVLNLPDRMLRIPASKIKYLEVSGHDLIYHTTDDTYNAYGSLKNVESQLNPRVFVRCNSCYLVNLNFVEAISGFTAFVDGTPLQISRSRRKSFIQQLNDYLGGNI